MIYFKYLNEGRKPPYAQKRAPWPEPGKWTRRVQNPVMCHTGWHACRPMDIGFHNGRELWIVELEGVRDLDGDWNKVVAQRARLLAKVELYKGERTRLQAKKLAVEHIPGYYVNRWGSISPLDRSTPYLYPNVINTEVSRQLLKLIGFGDLAT